jgi:Ca2+-binding EF-hand superfamily protein
VTQNFEMSQLKSKYELSFDEIKLMLDKFAMITSLNQEDTHLREEQRAANGLLYHEFCSLLKLKEDQRSSEMLFHFFDVSDDGVIDFVEFVRGISLLSGRVSDVERLKLAFAMLDTDEDGKIGLIELKEYLNDAIRVDQVRLVLETNGNGKNGDGRRGGEKQKEIHEAGTVVEEVEEESGGSSNTLRQSSLDSCFDAIDDDHDGRVNLEEFVLLAHEKTTLIGPLLEMAKEFIVLAMELEMGMETKEGEECRGETKSKVVENKELQLPI